MFSGKVAVVTGSTSGIGLGIATALARQGADIVLNGFGDAAEIERILSALESKFGVRVAHDGADLSHGEAVREMIDRAIATMGRIDILVNNAGIQHTASIEEFPVDRWDAILALNLSAVFHATAAALPHMKQQGAGRIINIASVHGLVGSVNKSAYVAAKHGVVGFTKVTALENAGTGITANAICPGWVRTALVEQQITALAEREGTDQEAAARAAGREAAFAAVRDARATGRDGGVPGFGRRSADHRHGAAGGWGLDGALAGRHGKTCQQGIPVGHEAAVATTVALGDPRVQRFALCAVAADIAQHGEAQAVVHQHLQPLTGHAGAQLEEVRREALHRNGDPLGLMPKGVADQIAQAVGIECGALRLDAQDADGADVFNGIIHAGGSAVDAAGRGCLRAGRGRSDRRLRAG